MWKLTRLSSLQETKSLASHPLRKIPQSLVGYKEKERENKNIYEKQSKCSVFYFLPKTVQRMHPRTSSQLFSSLPRIGSRDDIYKENYKQNIRGYSPFFQT